MAKRKATARVQVPIRMLEAMRAKLAKSAKGRGVSLNAEIVHRLNASLTNTESLMVALLGRRDKLLFAMIAAHHIDAAEQKTRRGWLDDDATYALFAQAIISDVRPPSGALLPDMKEIREIMASHFRRFE